MYVFIIIALTEWSGTSTMKEKIEEKWDEILNLLEVEYEVSPIFIKTWLKVLKIYEIKDNTIIFLMDEKLGKQGVIFVKDRLFDIFLRDCINEIFGTSYEIDIIVNPSTDIKTSNNYISSAEAIKANESNLNPKYTFDTFIIGDSNRHAHATCVAIAEAPASSYNPLFIYGGAGLGKTHLMQAVAHQILKNNPNSKVLYVPSEVFTNEVIESIKHNKNEEFREKYRNLDVLLIDDIQFIIGKDSTQNEFFNTFNILYNSNKQIIISSDKPPKDMETLEERIRSRLEWGVPVDIQSPDYETRMAILRNKAELDNINVPDEVLQYIANNIVSNVRELEGALNKISVYSKLGNEQINKDMAEDILKDLVSSNIIREITPELIVNTVAEHLNISYDDIMSKKRSKDIATARQIAMYLCRKLTDKSLDLIGEAVGGRDHSTVITGIKKIENLIKVNSSLANNIEVIKKKINP